MSRAAFARLLPRGPGRSWPRRYLGRTWVPRLPTGWGPLVISRVIRALNWVIRTLS